MSFNRKYSNDILATVRAANTGQEIASGSKRSTNQAQLSGFFITPKELNPYLTNNYIKNV